MLAKLHLKNLTVFADADFQFASGLNVVVGDNGAGKTHVLKTAYTVAEVVARGRNKSSFPMPTKSYLEEGIAFKLRNVFRADSIGNLARQQASKGRCEVTAIFDSKPDRVAFSFNKSSSGVVTIDSCPTDWEGEPPVYIPTRELLSIYPGFVSLYDNSEVPFEETYRDTCLLLGAPLAKGSRLNKVKKLLEPLEKQLGGKVIIENGRFFLETKNGKHEAHLVAEGMRKLAMIAQLIANGSLRESSSLFWDEPEANLNPKVIKRVGQTILQLCQSKIQVFVASHSLFLLRELGILLRNREFQNLPARFFGLHPGEQGVTVQQGETVDDIGKIDALDEELNQSDRYMATEAHA
jgi:ABC-type branched-subunit amino acid transport system ATPase component